MLNIPEMRYKKKCYFFFYSDDKISGLEPIQNLNFHKNTTFYSIIILLFIEIFKIIFDIFLLVFCIFISHVT